MVNGVLTIPLPGKSLGSRSDTASRASQGERLSGFIAGPENRLAASAVKALLADGSSQYRLLVLYGASGTGKSHLAQGIAEWWKKHFPALPALCTGGADFARNYAAAVDRQRVEPWRADYRAASLVVIEDLEQLAGKRAAQQELRHFLDAWSLGEATVVVTARTLPSQLPMLGAGLRSRLSAGLAVPLAVPGTVARRTILHRLASAGGISLPGRAIEALADSLHVAVPGLHSALLKLRIAADQDGHRLDSASIRRWIRTSGRTAPLTLRAITSATAKYFGLRVADLKSASRRQSVVAARGMTICLARQLTDASLEKIGVYLGGRDHTTVLHGYRRTERNIKRDPALRQAAMELKRTLLNA